MAPAAWWIDCAEAIDIVRTYVANKISNYTTRPNRGERGHYPLMQLSELCLDFFALPAGAGAAGTLLNQFAADGELAARLGSGKRLAAATAAVAGRIRARRSETPDVPWPWPRSSARRNRRLAENAHSYEFLTAGIGRREA
jgi:hypothetical protein